MFNLKIIDQSAPAPSQGKKNRAPSAAPQVSPGQGLLPAALLAAVLLLVPVFPDVQITRPELLVLELGIYSLMLFWLGRAAVSGRFTLRLSGMNLPVLLYFAYLSVSYYMTDNRPVASSELKRMLICTGMYLLASNTVDSEKGRLLVFSGWIAGSSLALAYGLMQASGGVWILMVPKMERVYSTFGNPIFFAAHLIFLLPVVLAVFFYTRNFWLRLLLGGLFAAGLLGIYRSQTRAAMIGFAVSMLFFGLLSLRSAKLRAVFLGLLVLSSAVFAVSTKRLWMRQQAHLLIWRDTVSMWSRSPLLGTGPGSFHISFPAYASKELLSIWPQRQNIINDAHNEYLQILSETGLAGLGIFLWMIFGFFRSGLLYRRKHPGNRQAVLVTGLLSGAAALLAQNIFSVDMRFIISAAYLFMGMGLVGSLGEKCAEIGLPGGREAKAALLAVLLLLSGAVGFSGGPALHIASVFHLGLGTGKLSLGPSWDGSGLLPALLKPYLAQKKMDETPGFFDEKVLEPARTIADLEELSKKYPGEARIYEKLGWVYAKERNFSRAIENYEKAVRLDPGLFGAYNNMGNICFHMNNRPRAIEYYKKSIRLKEGQVDAHVNMGIAYYYEGQLSEAAGQFNTVLKLDPQNEKAIVMLKRMRE